MSHTSVYEADGEEFHFVHNGDYSGDVVVSSHGELFAVPYKVLEELVLDKLRREAIRAFEEASHHDLKSKLLW